MFAFVVTATSLDFVVVIITFVLVIFAVIVVKDNLTICKVYRIQVVLVQLKVF